MAFGLAEQTVGPNGRTYLVRNGLWFREDTPDVVIGKVCWCYERTLKTRYRFYYGFTAMSDPQVGRWWGDEYGCTGYVRSTSGPIKVPMLVFNARCMGGHPIMTNRVLRIERANGGLTVYEHPLFYRTEDEKGEKWALHYDKVLGAC